MEIGTRVSIAATGALLVFMGAGEPVAAHPHVWIDAVVTFVFEDGHLVGLRHHWKFDEFFGSFVIEEHDVNRDGELERRRSPRSRPTPSPIFRSTTTSPMCGSTVRKCL
jgi:ABC-type uncharacterized transport system substrate-binding protein